MEVKGEMKFSDFLNEASLNHFYNQMTKKVPILIVTASRFEYFDKDDIKDQQEHNRINNANNKNLRKTIKLAGFGFNRVVGKYKELVFNKKTGKNELVQVTDDSCIVYAAKEDEKKLYNLGKALGMKYNQDSIFFMGETITGYKPVLVSTRDDGSLGKIGATHTLGSFHAMKDSDVMTKIRGKSYYFDWEDETQPNVSATMNESMIRKAFLKYLENNNSLDVWESKLNN